MKCRFLPLSGPALCCLMMSVSPLEAQAGLSGCSNYILDNLEQTILAQYNGAYQEMSFHDAKLVDIDADGDQDMFVLASLEPYDFYNYYLPTIYQFENRGTPTSPDFVLLERSVAYDFEEQSEFGWPEWYSMGFVDIDSDGDQDMVVSGFEVPTVGRNIGTPKVARLRKELIPGLDQDEYATQLSFTDLDGDGYQDAVLSSDNGVFLRKNNGNRRNLTFLLPPDSWSEISNFGYINGAYLYPAAFHDVDMDGDQDLLGGGPLLLNTGTKNSPYFDVEKPQFLTPYNNVIESSRMANGQFVDIDRDGDLDFIGFRTPYAFNDNAVVIQYNIGSATNPYYMPVSSVSGISVALAVKSASGGLAEVTMTLRNQGSQSQRVGYTTMSEESKTQLSRGPFYLTIGAGQTRLRRFQVEFDNQKTFSVILEDNGQYPLACQSVVLK